MDSQSYSNKIAEIFDQHLLADSLEKLSQYAANSEFSIVEKNEGKSMEDWVVITQVASEGFQYTARIYFDLGNAERIANRKFKGKMEIDQKKSFEMLKECSNVFVGHIKNIFALNELDCRMSIPLLVKKQMDLSFLQASHFKHENHFKIEDNDVTLMIKHEIKVIDKSLAEKISQLTTELPEEEDDEFDF